MKIFNLLSIASSRLFLEHVSNKVDNPLQNADILNKYLYSDFSLFEGVLALDTPAIQNFRFFGPFTERCFEQAKEAIWFKSDRSKDGKQSGDGINQIIQDPHYTLSYVACKLFPSIGEPELNIYTTHPSNLANVLDSSKSNGNVSPTNVAIQNLNKNYLHFLAGLLFCCTKGSDKITGKVEATDHGIELKIVKEKTPKSIHLNYEIKADHPVKAKTKLVSNLNALLSIDNSQLDESPLNSRVLIKAFIVSYLRDKIEVLEFMKYLENDLVKYFKTYPICENLDPKNNSLIFETLELAYFYSKTYPYYRNPPKSFLVPFYLGNDNFTDKSDRFSNCVESAIYHFLNCLLWNPHTNSYTIVYESDTFNQKAPISMIFQGNELKKDLSANDMLAWHELIEGLPEGKLREASQNPSNTINNDLKKNSFQNVFYNKTKNGVYNELYPGFINTLKIIEHVTSRGKKYTSQIEQLLNRLNWNITDAKSQIKKIIKDLIVDILGSDESLQEPLLDIDNFTNIVNGKKYDSYDFFGRLKVTKKCENFPNLEFELVVQDSHEFLSVSNPKLELSKLSLREDDSEDLTELIFLSKAPVNNLFKYIYFLFLDIMNLNDKIREELRSNLENSISTIKNSRIKLEDNDRVQIILKNVYIYIYEFLLFNKLVADDSTAKYISVAFKDIKNYIKQIEENCLLHKNSSKPSIKGKISKPLSTIASNLLKSIPMDDYGTFSIFNKLQTDNLEFFYNLDCFDNDYYLKKGIDYLYYDWNLSQEAINKILKEVQGKIPSKDKKNNMKFISYFLCELISKHVKSQGQIWLLAKVLLKFKICFDFLNSRNIEPGEKFILKFQNLFYFIKSAEVYVPPNAFLANCGAFYSEILDKVDDVDLRKEFYIEVFTEQIDRPRLFLNDLNYLLLNNTEMAIDIMQNLGYLYFIFDFLCYKLYINNEKFIEIVSSISSLIKKSLNDRLLNFNIKHGLLAELYYSLYQLQVYFDCLNKINESLESETRLTISSHLQNIKENQYYQFYLQALDDIEPMLLIKEDKIEIQKLYTTLYSLIENILINLKIFYKDSLEKINDLNNLLIKIVPYYSNELNFEEIYNVYYGPEIKEYHFSGDFDSKKIADGFSEFFKIIKELKNLIKSEINS